MSAPWMPFYVADYMADTAHLSTLEHGAYLLLIMTYWRQGGLPDDDTRLARIARLTVDEWINVRSTVVQFFGDGWSHKRIDEEISRADDKSKKASLAGKRSSESRNSHKEATNVQRALSERSADVPTDGQLSQPQSQPLEDRDASASLAVDKTPLVSLLDAAKRKKKLEELSALRLLGDDWNSLAVSCGLSIIGEIKPGSPRERHALARIRECADMAGAFTRIRGSPFLLGKTTDFRVSFDWITDPTNLAKVLEGNYNR